MSWFLNVFIKNITPLYNLELLKLLKIEDFFCSNNECKRTETTKVQITQTKHSKDCI